MPAKAPPVGDVLAAKLAAVGARIRAQRARQGVTASAAAEAAGLSRVTLHRIERGERSVTIGAYLSVVAAVGLDLELIDPPAPKAAGAAGIAAAARVRLSDYPQLRRLAWHMPGVTDLSPEEALSLYERNWRHIDHARVGAGERALLQALAATVGGGRLLV
jgi:transcriptional regulator with XRE-family HTH domain